MLVRCLRWDGRCWSGVRAGMTSVSLSFGMTGAGQVSVWLTCVGWVFVWLTCVG